MPRPIPTTALLVASALAAGPAAPGDAAERLRVGPATVSVPDAIVEGAVRPGTGVRVRVVRNRSGKRVTATLVRGSDDADPTSQRRTVRRGGLTFRLSRRGGTRYVLRLAVGDRQRSIRFVTLDPAAPRCDQSGTVDVTLTLGAATARAGETIPAVLENRGAGCVESGLKLEWEARQADGSYAAVPPPGPTTLELYGVQTGGRRDFTGYVWNTLAPGEYRAVVRVSSERRFVTVASGPFSVVG